MADEERDRNDKVAVSRRAFLKGGAAATGALSASLLPDVAEAQLPEATEADPRHATVEMKVNGVPYRADVPNRTTLLQFLRDDLKLTGTKMGCDRAQCGACTVVLNGRNVYSCTTLALEAAGGDVLTIEGLAKDDALHPIQQAFIEHSGFQCGFCTSGQIMTTKALLDRMPSPTEDQARLAGASLRGVALYSGTFQGADLRNTAFHGASLKKVSFCDSDLRGAVCTGADFSEADLRWANFELDDLADADLSAARIR